MKTPEQRIEEFKERMRQLLDEFGAEIYLEHVGHTFSCNDHIFVEMMSKWEDGQCVAEWAKGDLGTFICATP